LKQFVITSPYLLPQWFGPSFWNSIILQPSN